jgi:23S rRNA (uridine2552-2'-O)-methyltransferase
MAKKKKKWSDNWTKKAKEQGYAARSVFKLEELETRFSPLRGMKRFVDLGCAPGSWSHFVKRRNPRAKIVGIDFKEVSSYPGSFVQSRIEDIDPQEIKDALGGTVDIVLSDMAPNTTGNRLADHVRQLELADKALGFAVAVLRPGGRFVVKVFDGEDIQDYFLRVKEHFTTVKRLRPKATRNSSVEFFMLGLDFKPSKITNPKE